VLGLLRADAATAGLPVVVTTSKSLTAAEKQALEGLRAVVLSKAQLSSVNAVVVIDDALRRAALAVGRDAEALAARREH
jgi:hypothetical protein